MGNEERSRFLKWVVKEKSKDYSELAHLIKGDPYFPTLEKNILLIRDYVGGKNQITCLNQFEDAWGEYRTIPCVDKIRGF